MTSGWPGERRFRFDGPHPDRPGQRTGDPFVPAGQRPLAGATRLLAAIERTRDYLLARQAPEGFWVGELEGDTILESEYVLLLAFLGQADTSVVKRAANYILKKQLPGGGWAIYPGGPLEISASVKAYFALKLAGHSPDAGYMARARTAIREAGGAEQVNSFTRYYLALLGVISYDKCPAVPPEILLIPGWLPFNIYEMSAWSRTILVPLSLLWAFRPQNALPDKHRIDELFLTSPEELPATMAASSVVDSLKKPTWINWDRLFRGADRAIKLAERWRLKPFRRMAIRRAAEWIEARFADSDGLGAIFPPIVWSVIALKCLGHTNDSRLVRSALEELEKLSIREGDTIRLEPCRSPVWDTAIATIALCDAGMPADSPAIRSAVKWLLSKEVATEGDWTVRSANKQPGGWFFEFKNRFYPDVDDTAMVLIALTRTLSATDLSRWRAEYVMTDGSPGSVLGTEVSTVLTQRGADSTAAVAEIEALRPVLGAVSRGVRWIVGMQNRDGGWGAFDRDNDREIFTRVPFADHNAMIDPSTADLTARVLEMLSGLGMTPEHSLARRAIDFLWKNQEQDHCWFGRWGVNYIYGTWQTLVGLMALGVPASDPRIRRAVAWLKMRQYDSGGWGESPASYDDAHLRGRGTETASQTAWALLGLCAAGEVDSAAVGSGVQYLLDTQRDDGGWDEEEFTGTGFPKVFYLRYHLYRIYFPLMALSRVARLRRTRTVQTGQFSVENEE
ncbi:MAG TPA: terpene cyclase/mutase family protein [Planctomycetaceae bacterium]|nr:terpene cyclase/mutase family protein [Planctomycetaceae bacterium]